MPVPYLVLQVVRGVLQSALPERSRSAWSEGSGRVSPHGGSGKEAWNSQQTSAPGTLPCLERNVY